MSLFTTYSTHIHTRTHHAYTHPTHKLPSISHWLSVQVPLMHSLTICVSTEPYSQVTVMDRESADTLVMTPRATCMCSQSAMKLN